MRMDSHGGPETLSRSAGLGQGGRSAVKVCPREQSRPDPGVPRAGAYLRESRRQGRVGAVDADINPHSLSDLGRHWRAGFEGRPQRGEPLPVGASGEKANTGGGAKSEHAGP